MSTLITDQLLGRAQNDYVIGLTKNTTFKAVGQVIQFQYRVSQNLASYAANNDNVAREISELNCSITPKYSNSEIWIDWYVFYEATYNMVFQPLRNGTAVAWNTEVGNIRWSGLHSGDYESSWDLSSTPTYKHMTYVDLPGTTSSTTYQLGVKSSDGGNNTFYLNRAFGSYGDNNESGVSFTIIREIAR